MPQLSMGIQFVNWSTDEKIWTPLVSPCYWFVNFGNFVFTVQRRTPLEPFFFSCSFHCKSIYFFRQVCVCRNKGTPTFLHHSFLVFFLNVQVRAAFFWHLCVCSAKGSLGPPFPIIPTSCHFFSGAFQGCIEDWTQSRSRERLCS